MKVELWLTDAKTCGETTSITLPDCCKEDEYVVFPGSTMQCKGIATVDAFSWIQKTWGEEPNGRAVLRVLVGQAFLAERQEGELEIPTTLLQRAGMEEGPFWLIRGEKEDIFTLVTDAGLAPALARKERLV